MLTPFISWLLDLLQILISVLFENQKSSSIKVSKTPKVTTPPSSPSNQIKDSIPILNKVPSPSPTIPNTNPSPSSNPIKLNFVSQNVDPLDEQDFKQAAEKLGVETATIKAVFTVESRGSGFLSSKRPKILFEAHHFSKFTKGVYDQTHPDISSKTWNKTLYKGNEKEYDRLNQAIGLNQSAALKSASWGLFQILGSNYKACGFSCVEDFVKANVESHKLQLEGFVNFIKSTKLDIYLKNKDWTSFAKYYNGAGYAANQYDSKLKQAYQKFVT